MAFPITGASQHDVDYNTNCKLLIAGWIARYNEGTHTQRLNQYPGFSLVCTLKRMEDRNNVVVCDQCQYYRQLKTTRNRSIIFNETCCK